MILTLMQSYYSMSEVVPEKSITNDGIKVQLMKSELCHMN